MAQVDIVNKEVNGMTFKCRVAGNPSGEPVVLLHGWPETSHMWVELMEKLSAEGYYCIAPDQRGFSPSARPEKVEDYEVELLAQDIFELANAFELSNYHLVGHDWGSVIGWTVITLYPEKVKSWTALSVGHVRAFSDAIRFNAKQKKMSRYMWFFQWKNLPEWYLLKKDRLNLRKVWKKSSPEQLQDYMETLGNKPALKASLNYYRANYKRLKKATDIDRFTDVSTPTLLIWGKRDIAIGEFGIDETKKYMKGDYKRVDLNAGHWLMQEAFEECAASILEHLNRNK